MKLDFLGRPELVLRRYRLTRLVPELRKREVLENERYAAVTRAYLRDHLPADGPPFLPMALSALIDAMHRSAPCTPMLLAVLPDTATVRRSTMVTVSATRK